MAVTAQDVEVAAAEPLAYFSHDADAASDIKCRKLLRRRGVAGYGRWWLLCEHMAKASGHSIQISEEEDAEILAEDLQFESIDELMSFLGELADLNLIDFKRFGSGEIWSNRMGRNAEVTGIKRAAGREGGKLGAKYGKLGAQYGKLGGRPKKIKSNSK